MIPVVLDGVDTGSVVYQHLPTSSGTVALDAVKLGLPGSLNYNIRVFPTDRNGKVIGQASATSMLTVDDVKFLPPRGKVRNPVTNLQNRIGVAFADIEENCRREVHSACTQVLHKSVDATGRGISLISCFLSRITSRDEVCAREHARSHHPNDRWDATVSKKRLSHWHPRLVDLNTFFLSSHNR